MNIEPSGEAAEYGRQASRAFAAAGGDRLAPLAEAEPERRGALVEPVLRELGAWELRPRDDPDDLEAAAALCRSAGYRALAYPLAERLARPAGLGTDGLLVVDGPAPRAPVAGLDLRWTAVTLDGRRGEAVVRSGERSLDSAVVAELDVRPLDAAGAGDVALGLVLPCWTLLGMLDRALDLTRSHVLARHQFGEPLARRQGVRFQLADAEVERGGAEALAAYALWSVQSGRAEALDDALALRLAALEAAEAVFRTAHLLHGAMGFCDESPLSWVSRCSRPVRWLPLGLSATRDHLARRLGRHGLTGLFSEAAT
ncbi:acyl-CoA dehydrogenase family protein [Actinomadura fibrosa]|uniref:Acyl-CoA dehydrogenase family protein n=1 Tax=Actinomadura fibrosa TaxID=111802 RepID=A0ABW2XZ27_9ACTN|nr:acyl-CoA dehydrogenase family protein [Actinomadura fibrosa]